MNELLCDGDTLTEERGAGPLVTVIIPTYNDIEHLCEAVFRFRAQTWRELEIIIVDDGSMINPAPEVVEWQRDDDRIKFYSYPQNKGVPSALMAGLDRARGSYIYFASTNDPVDPSFIEESVLALQSHGKAGMCFSDSGVIFGWGERHQDFPLFLSGETTHYTSRALTKMQRRAPFHISSNTVLYRIEPLRAIGGGRPEFKVYADWFTTMLVGLREGAVYIPRVFCRSRIHSGSYSTAHSNGGRRDIFVNMLRVIVEEFPNVLSIIRNSCVISRAGFLIVLAARRDPTLKVLIDYRCLYISVIYQAWKFFSFLVPVFLRRWLWRYARSLGGG